jgi:hypothetical protein
MAGIELSRLAFEFQLAAADGPLQDKWQRLLNVVADFQLVVDQQVLWSESQFPVIEFALQLSAWLAESPELGSFSYDSLESDVPGLIRFDSSAAGWSVSSAHQPCPSPAIFSEAELCEAARTYIERVSSSVRHAHGFDPFEGHPSPAGGRGAA